MIQEKIKKLNYVKFELLNIVSYLIIIFLFFNILVTIGIFQENLLITCGNFICMFLWPILHNYKINKSLKLMLYFYVLSIIIIIFTEYIDSVLKLNIIYGNYEHSDEIKKFGTIIGVPIIIIPSLMFLLYISIPVTDGIIKNSENIISVSILNVIVYEIFDILIESVSINEKIYKFENIQLTIFDVPLQNMKGRIIVDLIIFLIFRSCRKFLKIKFRKYKNISNKTLIIFIMFNILYLIKCNYIFLKLIIIIYQFIILILSSR